MLNSLLRTTGGPRGRRRKSLPALENLEDRTLLTVAYPTVHLLNPAAATAAALPAGFSPAQIRHAYGFDQIAFGSVQGDGSGQTIAIIDAYDQPNLASDLANFDATYGIAAPPSFTKVNESGGTALPAASQSWGLEESLDVEWAHAIAPGAKILLVEANSASFSDLITAVNYARSQPGVSVVSMSWGAGEFSGESGYDGNFTTPSGHTGVTFVASSGDSGSSGAPEYPSVSPNVLAVGGTQLSADSSGNYLGETAWSGSGGGLSLYESQPAYQKGVVTQTTTVRGVPDVAYNGSGSSPFAVYDTSGYGGWLEVYGTSAGAPQWAALVAISDQGRALAGEGALDGASQTLPMLYQLPASDFHDITVGSNGGFSASTGYDLVTGRGSPYANLVVAGLVGSSSMPPPTGQPPRVVAPASATPNPVTGTTTGLSVAASDPQGGTLTYTWSVVTEPAGAQAPTFGANGTSSTANTTARFYRAGSYTFQVTIADPSGLTATSSVSVTVNQTESAVTVTPGSASLSDGASQQFAATAKDQFGNALATQPAWVWTLSAGVGTVTAGGLYTAPATGSGAGTLQVSGGGLSATAGVTFGSAPAAPSNLVATLISSRQVGLSWTDNSGNESGFVIQRSTNGGSWASIGQVGENVTTFTDSSVSKRHTYVYRVYAFNSFGNSAYSNTSATIKPGVATVRRQAPAAVGYQAALVSGLATVPGTNRAAATQFDALAEVGPATVVTGRDVSAPPTGRPAAARYASSPHGGLPAGDAFGLGGAPGQDWFGPGSF